MKKTDIFAKISVPKARETRTFLRAAALLPHALRARQRNFFKKYNRHNLCQSVCKCCIRLSPRERAKQKFCGKQAIGASVAYIRAGRAAEVWYAGVWR